MVLPVPLLFLITISGVVDSQFGLIRYTRSSICTLTGSTVTLDCSYSYPSPYIQFSFWTTEPMPFGMMPSDLATDPQYQERVLYLGDMMHDCSMMLKNVVEQDERVYFFVIVLTSGQVHYEGGVNLSVTGLQVKVPEKVTEGAAVTLTCTSTCTLTGYPRFTWYLGGHYSPTYTTDTNKLDLQWVSKRDFSTYSCGLQGSNYRSPAVPLNIQYSHFTVLVSVSPAGDVLEGDEVTLTCGCAGYPPVLYYYWYKDINFKHSGGSYTISNVSSADSGVYRCSCSNEYDERSDSVMLTVLYPPRNVAVSIVPSAEAIEGGLVELTCRGEANPPAEDYRWYKKGSLRGRRKTLTIKRIRLDDAGEYKCSAGNKHGSRFSAAVQLSVLYPPRSVSVSVSPSGDIVEGSSVNLTCSCDANPPADYTWYKGGLYPPRGRTFTIDPVSSEDAGKYSCKCWNKFGWGSDTATLKVSYPPKNVSVFVSPSGEILEGTWVTLTCSGDANPSVRDYTWLKGTSIKGKGRTYTINNIGANDGGEYKCLAGNDHGHSSATLLLDVKYPPKSVLASVSPSGDVMEGSSVTFKCSSDANPPVEDYAWYKGGVLQGEGRTYTVTRMGIRDSGKYRCEAKNQHGVKTSNTATLSVLPQRNNVSVSVHPPGDIVEGESVTLTCSGDADPPVTEYTWYKGAIRKGSGRTYGIHRISSNDSGEYKCLGSNQHGDQFSIAVHLNVLYPPKSVAVSAKPSGDITKGTSVVLTCSGDANPPPPAKNYTWYRDGALLGRGRTFRVDGFSPEDAGEYECTSGNAYGSRGSDPVSLRLSYPPRNVSVSVSPPGEITEGGSVMLTCRGDANPPVREYAWFKSGAKRGTGRTYSINRTSSGDSGEYKCQASNEHGYQFSAGVRLNVSYPPKSVRVSVSPPGESAEGASVTLTCSADANPPAVYYRWYKGRSLVGTGRTYSVHNVSSEDSGEYECRSGNGHGEKSARVTLDVLHPPKSVSVLVSPAGGVAEGDTVTLTCRARANPPMETYTWFTEGGASLIGFGQSYSFTFGPESGGRYLCLARNAYGYGRSAAVEVNSNVSPSSGITVYVAVGIVCAGVAALLSVFFCTRWKRQQRNRHDYENDNPHTDSRTHTPLNNLPSAPARIQPGPPDATYTALDPRTISPDYATLVTVKNRH